MPKAQIENLDTSRIALIMSVALDEFSQHRYQDASFNHIIKASHMAKGTMYYYFTSKEDLFLTLYKATVREFNRLLPLIRQAPTEPDEFWQNSRELLLGFHQLLLTKPSIGQFVLNFLVGGERQDEHPARGAAITVGIWLQNWLERGQRVKALRSDLSAASLATLCWGIWQAIHPSRCQVREKSDHTELLLDLLQRLLAPMNGEESINLASLNPQVDQAMNN